MFVSSWHTLAGFLTAFVLGTAIGAERQWRQRSAGLRTTVLVALGSAAFSDLGIRLAGPEGSTRVVAYIVSGIGFLGAGAILKDGGTIRGLNTAGTLWCAAGVGAFSGCGFPVEAAMLTLFVLAGNTLLRPLVDAINRSPISERTTEAVYAVHAVCAPADTIAVRDALFEVLEAAGYPIRNIESHDRSDDQVELVATLIPSSASTAELDAATDRLQAQPAITRATWVVGSTS